MTDIFTLNFLLYMLAGSVAGVLAGLFGIGGGMVIVSALVWVFSYQGIAPEVVPHLAVGTSLATIIVTSISSLSAHHKRGAVQWSIWRHMAPGLVLGSLVGAYIAARIQGQMLQAIIGMGAFAIGLKMLFIKTQLNAETDLGKLPSAKVQAATGGFIGVVSAVFGIGGGTLTVPFLSSFGLKMQHAIGTSAACGLPIAAAGALGFAWFGQRIDPALMPKGSVGFVHLVAFFGVSLASFFTAKLGARLAHRLPAATLKKAFACLLLVVGAQLIWDAGVLG